MFETDKYGNLPMHLAAKNGHTDIVKLFAEHGVNAEAENFDSESVFHCG
jgi:ankyrin repeat protein